MCARISARTGRSDKHLAADASQNKEEQPTSEEEEEEAQLRRLTGEEGRHRKYTGTHTLTHTHCGGAGGAAGIRGPLGKPVTVILAATPLGVHAPRVCERGYAGTAFRGQKTQEIQQLCFLFSPANTKTSLHSLAPLTGLI